MKSGNVNMAANVAFYTDRLNDKEQELNDVQAAFYKYKLKTKVKLDQLRKEVLNFCNEHGHSVDDSENHALLLIRLAENEASLEASCRETEFLQKEVSRKQKQLNDQNILIKNLEEQLRSSQPLSPVEIEEKKRAAQMLDMDRIHQQIMFKDERIVELNNVILDKERQILDLQELCREQGEVASVTSQAARIVQRQWEAKNREKREIGTETDALLLNQNRREVEVRARTNSPGRAIVDRGSVNISPPPLDPSEVFQRTGNYDDSEDLSSSSNFSMLKSPEHDSSLRKKNRKRVTFDLLSDSQQQSTRILPDENSTNSDLASELLSENERLRKELQEATTSIEQLQCRLNENDADMTRIVQEGKVQSLKARVVAQARIKELENRMAELSEQHNEQVDRLRTEIESLRSTREWEVEQNAQLRDQLSQVKIKNHKLTEELDASENANREWEIKVSRGEEFLNQLIEDLIEAEDIIDYMERQKHSILNDVDKLKDAIIAQDQLIEILEADIVIYEEHIGILRESLGASKIDHRSLIRSKAFETKLKALEKEKEQIDRRCNEDRLRTKALDHKCKVLEQENEKLMAKLCELEMRERDEADVNETCQQLQRRIAELEEKAAVSRAECELRIESARLEAEKKGCEATRLLEELYGVQQQLAQRNLSSEEPGNDRMIQRVDEYSKQIQLDDQTERKASTEHTDQVLNDEGGKQLDSLQEELNELKTKNTELAEELDRMRCTNFELMTKVSTIDQTLKETETEKKNWQDMYENALSELSLKDHEIVLQKEKEAVIKAELDEAKAKFKDMREHCKSLEKDLNSVRTTLAETEATLACHQVDLGDYKERIDRLEEELFAARSELDNARLGLQETTAVKKELEHLKEELEHERCSGRAKWEEVCNKVLEHESNSPQSRKNSLEVINKVQHQEYMAAFEEKITCLEKSLQEARNKNEQDKVEKKKLKLALKQLKDKLKERDEAVDEDLSQQHNVATEEALLVTSEPSVSRPIHLDVDIEKLQDTIKALELENRLSRELNTEYNHTMLEMEKEVITLKTQISTLREESKHFEMELKLHEVLEEELERELSQARLKNEEISNAMNSYEETLGNLSEQVNNDTQENDMRVKELTIQVAELREQNRLLIEKLINNTPNFVAEQCTSVRSQQLSGSNGDVSQCGDSGVKASSILTRRESEHTEKPTDKSKNEIVKDVLEHKPLTELSGWDDDNVETTAVSVTTISTSEKNSNVSIETCESISIRNSCKMESSPRSNTLPEEDSLQSPPTSVNTGREIPTSTDDLPNNDLFAENLILRQCVNESNQMQKDLSQDVEKMWILKAELENTVEALKGEIWSLNSQLKASVLDREQLQDRVVHLDSSLMKEKKRADALDCELSEQTELTEKATRQAAEAENQSNRRLAECLEMETRREQVEKAYAQLSEYYRQLQAAYNVIYAQMKQLESEKEHEKQQQHLSTSSSNNDNIVNVVDMIISELNLDSSNLDLHGKILLIRNAVRAKLTELEECHLAIEEHRRTNGALHEQLQCLEEECQKTGGECKDTKTRMLQLEGDLQWKEDECVSLRRRVDELQATVNQLNTSTDENDAAKLATRQADVDALFRANAELVHSNVRLQNELDANEDGMDDEPHEHQDELSKSRQNERMLLQRVEELEEQLLNLERELSEKSHSEKIIRSMVNVETQHENAELTESLVDTYEEEIILPQSNVILNAKELTDLRNEVERLKAVEVLLNERIMALEDQLLEGEERLQEIEDELMDERQKSQSLQADNVAMREKLAQSGNPEQNKESSEFNLQWNNAPETSAGHCEQRMLEVSTPKQTTFQMTFDEMSSFRDVGKTDDGDGLWDSGKLAKVGGIFRKAVEGVLFSTESSILLNSSANERTVENKVEESVHDQKMEHTERKYSTPEHEQESTQERIRSDEVSKSTTAKEEGWDFDDLQDDDNSAQTSVNDKELFKSDFDHSTKHSKELEERLMQAYQRISELEVQIEQKVCALVDAEKELAVLRERQNVLENEASKKNVQAESDLATERDRRQEAEALASNLRNVAATLGSQIEDIQQKWLEEIQKVEDKEAEIGKLRSIVASRKELQEAEHQRSESEMETLCEERKRVQDELTSAENEKMRLEEQLISSKTFCESLKTELQIQKANYSEIIEKYEEACKCCEDAQAMLSTVDAEKVMLRERLENEEKSVDELRCKLEKCEMENKEAIQKLTSALGVKENHVNTLQTTLEEIQKELKEKEVQNSLLKDSEARLLDSVDEYGLQAEKYQLETGRLQRIVSVLEKERLELQEKLEELEKKMESRSVCKSTSTTSLRNDEESLLLSRKFEAATTELNEVRSRLAEAESRLDVAIKEKNSIALSYEQLRKRLIARRQAVTAAGETSQRSSRAPSEASVPEKTLQSEDTPHVTPVLYETHQVIDSDVLRRRVGHH